MSDKKTASAIDLNNLKAGGFIKERGKDLFTVRLRVPGGRMTPARLRKIAETAEKYGGEFVHFSVRQSVELVNINFRDFDAVVAELGEAGQKVASCGARVRVPTACGGCEYNPNGLVDTQKSALEVDEKLFGTPTGHHKFKVGFAGCPFDCPKSATNDVGFQGAILPELNVEDCISLRPLHQELHRRGDRGGCRRQAFIHRRQLHLLRRLCQGLPHGGMENREEGIHRPDRRKMGAASADRNTLRGIPPGGPGGGIHRRKSSPGTGRRPKGLAGSGSATSSSVKGPIPSFHGCGKSSRSTWWRRRLPPQVIATQTGKDRT